MRSQAIETEETTRETEEDADAEIAQLKYKYERRLKDEKEIGFKLKGENGVMRKKFNTLQSEIDAQKSEINKMYTEEKKLHSVIKSLEKDISGLKKEVCNTRSNLDVRFKNGMRPFKTRKSAFMI